MPVPGSPIRGRPRLGRHYPVMRQGRNFSSPRRWTQPYCTAEDTSRCPSLPWTITAKAFWTMNVDEQPVMNLTEGQLGRVNACWRTMATKSAIGGKTGQSHRRGATGLRGGAASPPIAAMTIVQALEREARRRSPPPLHGVQ